MKLLLPIAVAAVLTGCASSASPTAGSSAGHPRADARTSAAATGWAALVTIPKLGAFSTRCGRRPRAPHTVFAARYVASLATETVSLAIDGGPAARRTLQPGQAWVTALRRTRRQVWRVAQSTEAQTIAATVRIRPSRCPYGVPATRMAYGTSHFTSR